MIRIGSLKLWHIIKGYLDNTSIHGLRYLTQGERHWIERAFWVLACCFSTYCCYNVTLTARSTFENSAVTFAPETTYLHWNTGFPAVTVCEKRQTNKIWALAQRLLPTERNGKLSKMSVYLGNMIYYQGTCNICEVFCRSSIDCPMNILEMAKEVFSNCTDILGDCYWNNIKFECCDYFSPQLTPYGICYVINSLQTKQNNFKKQKQMKLTSNKSNGPGKLEFKFYLDAKFYVHSPEDVVHFGMQTQELQDYKLGKDYKIYFRVTEIVNDPQLSDLSTSQRGCILPHENPLKMFNYYSTSACISECQAEAQGKLCGCTHHYIPGKQGHRDACNLTGVLCLHKYANYLNSMDVAGSAELNVSCSCIRPSCSESEYLFLRTDVTQLYSRDWSNVHLKMLTLPTERYRRNIVRSKLDLVVSTGGIVALFLGASLLSIVEFVMYFCIRKMRRN